MDKPKIHKLPTDKLTLLLRNRTNLVLIGVLVLIVGASLIAIPQLTKNNIQKQTILEEIDLTFDPEGPYAQLLPRRDGNALILNIKRVSAYDAINYELAYQSKIDESEEPIDRGVTGSVDTKSKKSEYSQEILFGTCSKGDTFSTRHCVFDKNVENGTLTLKIQKDNKVYKMTTGWHLQKPDISLGEIVSADTHFIYKTQGSRSELANTAFTIVNDLSSAPKLPENKQVFGKVYSFNVPATKSFPKGKVSIETAEKPSNSAKIGFYNESKGEWEILDTKIDGSTLTATGTNSGIYTVLIDKTSN